MIHTNLIADEVPGCYNLLITDEFATDIHFGGYPWCEDHIQTYKWR